MRQIAYTVGLLFCSNIFMTFAWYAHLKDFNNKPWFVAALVSWGIALLEYIFQVPANRIGFSVLTISQLKILQEVITLSVFVPFSFFYMDEPPKIDYLWAGLCLVGAVYFVVPEKFEIGPPSNAKRESWFRQHHLRSSSPQTRWTFSAAIEAF